MSETDKWKFNFSSWPSVRVIALPWAHLERKMKSSWGRGEAAGSRVCAKDPSVCRARMCSALPPHGHTLAQASQGPGFWGRWHLSCFYRDE